MAGRKVFTAGEVLQAADVNDFLMDQSVMVFAGTAARGSAIPSPSEGMVTYLADADELQVYTTDWGGVGGGKILQVLSTIKTDTFTTTSTSFTDVTGLNVSITPSSTSSKIYVMMTVTGASAQGDSNSRNILRLMRDSTEIAVGTASGSRLGVSAHLSTRSIGSSDINLTAGVNFLDSPNSTSALTYKVQAVTPNGGALYINRTESDTDNNSNPRTVSTITVMEVTD